MNSFVLFIRQLSCSSCQTLLVGCVTGLRGHGYGAALPRVRVLVTMSRFTCGGTPLLCTKSSVCVRPRE